MIYIIGFVGALLLNEYLKRYPRKVRYPSEFDKIVSQALKEYDSQFLKTRVPDEEDWRNSPFIRPSKPNSFFKRVHPAYRHLFLREYYVVAFFEKNGKGYSNWVQIHLGGLSLKPKLFWAKPLKSFASKA